MAKPCASAGGVPNVRVSIASGLTALLGATALEDNEKGNLNTRSCFLNKLRFQLHCADTSDLTINVVIALDKPNILNFGSNFDY